jgi:hypothetical protein
VVGRNALIVHDFERPVNVTGFDKKVANIKAMTVTAVVAYDDPVSGETILLIINQVIYIYRYVRMAKTLFETRCGT